MNRMTLKYPPNLFMSALPTSSRFSDSRRGFTKGVSFTGLYHSYVTGQDKFSALCTHEATVQLVTWAVDFFLIGRRSDCKINDVGDGV